MKGASWLIACAALAAGEYAASFAPWMAEAWPVAAAFAAIAAIAAKAAATGHASAIQGANDAAYSPAARAAHATSQEAPLIPAA